ncbi:MAG TPA: NapC/NirT family cytochrome c [Zeimonas sp.]
MSDSPRISWKTLLGLGFVGVLAGVVLVVGGAAGLAWTSTESFCIGCHEMKDNVYAEYKGTVHDANHSGVRAICTDCHVPREVGPLLLRKAQATFEVFHKLTGKIDTREKFLMHRADLAERVWTRMLKTDSHECRNCHVEAKFSEDLQTEKAWARHQKARAEGWTCIECHYGIAHEEPEGDGPVELRAKLKLPRQPAAGAASAAASSNKVGLR